MNSPREEFVWETKNGKEEKWYDISALDRFDEILREDNRAMWERIKRGWQKEMVDIYTPINKKYESEPEMVKVATLPVEDAKRKFG
jgi:hypothetical protein